VIADSSAWIVAWRSGGKLWSSFGERVLAGAIWTAAPIVLELLRGARDPVEHDRMSVGFAALPASPVDGWVWHRALEVQGLLTRGAGGPHRGVPPIDLLVAAAAEQSGVPVLHRDPDYEAIAAVTGQPLVWLEG
jgi:hypothetical protein